MHNFLLDPLPEEYEGYLMRTDYRVGIQISQALADPELAGYEGLLVAVNLLFGQGAPDYQTAIEGLQWFLQAGEVDELSLIHI